jgi:hypothetical protein
LFRIKERGERDKIERREEQRGENEIEQKRGGRE